MSKFNNYEDSNISKKEFKATKEDYLNQGNNQYIQSSETELKQLVALLKNNKKICETYLIHLNKEQNKKINPQLTEKKIQIITQAKNTLPTKEDLKNFDKLLKKADITQKIIAILNNNKQNFYNVFLDTNNQKILKSRQDKQLITFLKAIFVSATLGLAYSNMFGKKSTEGKKLLTKINLGANAQQNEALKQITNNLDEPLKNQKSFGESKNQKLFVNIRPRRDEELNKRKQTIKNNKLNKISALKKEDLNEFKKYKEQIKNITTKTINTKLEKIKEDPNELKIKTSP